MKRALITGVRGQDGSYLAELLLDKGYEVIGMLPHRNGIDMSNLERCRGHTNFKTVDGDMTDAHSLDRVLIESQPDEIYNLAAQSFVGKSWNVPAHTANVNYMGFVNLIEAVTSRSFTGLVRIYQASTSEMFGSTEAPQSETTPMDPCSPYGVSKLAAHKAARNYRDSYGIHVSCGIMFNHESFRRPEHFLTQKVAKAVAMIARGDQKELRLGNLDAWRDWGWAPDYVHAMWEMLQLSKPTDLIIGTGESHSVQQFVDVAFRRAGLYYEDHVVTDPEFVRPVDVPHLRANTSEAKRVIGWEPTIKFYDLVEMMVDHWMEKLS